ncbi:hypothetical protein D1821_07480 [Phaeobacter inhibens]|nr:hypothetical protein BWR17_01370 [Phaeobacter inhibens]AXT42244.1 hypothetical protein D1821_07480 [Phaeobacter inhibens]
MLLRHHDFRRFLDALGKLNPARIEGAQTKILNLRRKSEAISDNRSTDKPAIHAPIPRRSTTSEVGPNTNQGPALPMLWLP